MTRSAPTAGAPRRYPDGDRLPPVRGAETFGARLRRLRRARDITQAQLGDMTGLSGAMVGLLEWGRYRAAGPTAQTLWILARALGVSMEYLWRGDER